MNEKHNTFSKVETSTFQNVPAPVGSPGEKIAELARRDRQHRPEFRNTLEDAPEFSAEDLPSEPAGVHRMPYKPRQYRAPGSNAAGLQASEKIAAGSGGAGELLTKLESLIRERPAPALAVAALAGFAIGKLVR